MSVTPPAGLARQVNRAVLTATLAFGGSGLVALALVSLWARRGGAGASLVYGISLLACALCSFLYNMLERTRRRALLRWLDHAAIFLLIAGTYTPFAAAGLSGPFGGSLLAWVWALAAAGIVLKLVLPRAHDRAFVAVYLALGWIFLWAGDEVLRAIPALPLLLLAAGGLAYTVGAVIYARDIGRWTDPVWHCCVLAGIVAHFLAVVAFRLAPAIG
ncbi:MAG: PAQR family membrane homeostasis protein TrhA [Stellaceae bacterium]